jgi:hypothetical protein
VGCWFAPVRVAVGAEDGNVSRLVEILFLAPVAVGMGYAWWLIYTAERDWNGVWRQWEDKP